MVPIAPTSLPPIWRLAGYSVAEATRNLRALSQLYWPPPLSLPANFSVPKRNLTRPKISGSGDYKFPDSGYASAVVSDDECDAEESLGDDDSDSADSLDRLRADPMERAFAIKWIMGLISRIDELSTDDWPDIDPGDAHERLLDEATALLAHFSRHNDEEEPDITRSFVFPSLNGTSICIQLNDAPLSISDHTAVGLQSWGSAIVLAERICADPASFNLADEPLRILELGAGTGLLSIAAAKLLPRATVVATDYHPTTLANLAANLCTNFPPALDQDQARISARELDWARPVAFDAPFDVVLAADVVYHPDHARWLRGCAERMLRLPGTDPASGSTPGGVFHLIVPVRTSGRHEGIDRTVDEVFGIPVLEDNDNEKGYHLAILDAIDVARQRAGVGRADEAGYRMFKIGWVT
ncbi:S-adenosyl-L-methionine-dependent methyltransferase [Mycena pura]|uniref:S-adenosyl-L-methionine-dependent methyltransferase n=1 Tax=Mycena pura TaxID=153505 RepID=A0AAD6YUM9_9AGAR|nr:S-adenosyl-L-methionine-dependent methyltransferase [Mycena pura]